jgi:hypothetical protein
VELAAPGRVAGLYRPAVGAAHLVQSSYAFKSGVCDDARRSDPVTMIFHHEDFVVGNGCGIPGNHAIDQNGS